MKSDYEMHLAIPDLALARIAWRDLVPLMQLEGECERWERTYDPMRRVIHLYLTPPADPDLKKRFNLALAPLIEEIRAAT